MKRKSFLKVSLFALLEFTMILSACKEQKGNQAEAMPDNFTCPMHPQIIQTRPGTCPICGMDLVLFDRNNQEAKLILDKNQQALANVHVAVIGSGKIGSQTMLNGRLVKDPQSNAVVSSRIAGRLETLYIKEFGVNVSKGQPLYRIYSEQLMSLQQEYLLARAQSVAFKDDKRFNDIAAAAEQRLMLYQQTEAQIRQLIKSGKPEPYFTYFSPVSGKVSELFVTEGQYVGEGTTLMEIENYDRLWVEADIYPSEIIQVRKGMMLQVIVGGNTGTKLPMRVEFIEPAIDPKTQLIRIRGNIANPNKLWQPGLSAQVILPGKVSKELITVPSNAIVRDGASTHVWKEEEANTFVPVEVVVGEEGMNGTEIVKGLQGGDRVVVSGAYLLYSEFILKKGRHPVMQH